MIREISKIQMVGLAGAIAHFAAAAYLASNNAFLEYGIFVSLRLLCFNGIVNLFEFGIHQFVLKKASRIQCRPNRLGSLFYLAFIMQLIIICPIILIYYIYYDLFFSLIGFNETELFYNLEILAYLGFTLVFDAVANVSARFNDAFGRRIQTQCVDLVASVIMLGYLCISFVNNWIDGFVWLYLVVSFCRLVSNIVMNLISGRFFWTSLGFIKSEFVSASRAVLHLGPASLIGHIANQGEKPIIAYSLGLELLGIYDMLLQIPRFLKQFLTLPQSVTIPIISKAPTMCSAAGINNEIKNALAMLLLVNSIVFAYFFVFGDPLLKLLYGEKVSAHIESFVLIVGCVLVSNLSAIGAAIRVAKNYKISCIKYIALVNLIFKLTVWIFVVPLFGVLGAAVGWLSIMITIYWVILQPLSHVGIGYHRFAVMVPLCAFTAILIALSLHDFYLHFGFEFIFFNLASAVVLSMFFWFFNKRFVHMFARFCWG